LRGLRAGERHLLRIWREIDGRDDAATLHREPTCVFVEFHANLVQTAVGQLGRLLTQPDQFAIMDGCLSAAAATEMI